MAFLSVAAGVWSGAATSTAALALVHPESPVREDHRALAANQIEREVEEHRATEEHTDYYSVLRLEIEALRRAAPEHGEFLERYLQSLLPR
jgi:hypothetical protein